MNGYRAGAFAAMLLLVGGVLTAAAAATQPLTSRWADREIRVDGVNDEWRETSPLDEMINVGAANDGEFLYFTVITSDEVRRRQLATAGLVVWLDSSGGKKQSFGIRLPGSGFFASGQRGRRGDANDAPPPEVQPPAMTYIELLGPGKKDRRRIELIGGADISAAVGFHEGTVVYELRVPLAKTTAHEYAIGTEPGRKIGVGLETPEVERPEGAPEGRGFGGRGGAGRGGFGGGRGGGRAGGARGGGEGRNFQQAKPLKVWTTIQLATGGADVAPRSSR